MSTAENPFAGQGSVLLDIGDDVGALVVTMPGAMVDTTTRTTTRTTRKTGISPMSRSSSDRWPEAPSRRWCSAS